jgi:acetyl-CoA acetyltransferase
VVLCSAAGLEKAGLSPEAAVVVQSVAVATGSLYEDPPAPGALSTPTIAAARAYDSAGLGGGGSGPRAAGFDIVEVHDCFTVSELLLLVALGLADSLPDAAARLRAGEYAASGPLPVNVSGGLLGCGHPVGATGVRQIAEIVQQMQGRAPAGVQLVPPPRRGLSANLGGDDKTAVVSVLENNNNNKER